MPTILIKIGSWLFRNPIMIAVIILSLSTTFYMVQARYHKAQAQEAILKALGAEEALTRTRAREKALHALETKQRQENEEINRRIGNRTYFDTVDGVQ